MSSNLGMLSPFALIGSGLLAWQAWRMKQKIAVLDDTPTTPAGRIASAGYYEVKGKVVCPAPLMSPGANVKCAYYRVVNRRRIEESYVDSRGHNQTRTRTEETVTDEQHSPFHIEDRSGKIAVDPLGAEFRVKELVRVRHDVAGSFFGSWTTSWFGRREPRTLAAETRVEGIADGAGIYAIGTVKRAGSQLCFQHDTQSTKPYILSCESETEIVGAYTTQMYLWGAAAAVALVVAMALPFV